jgi:biotin carboxyl carrier protein
VTHHDAAPERTPDERRADHAAIDRLADELLPALVAKLGASGLGELDVREGGWRVRLRMPGDGRGARRTAAAGRGAGRMEPHAPHAPGAPAAGAATTVTAAAGSVTGEDPEEAPTRVVATSPAVGFFRARADLAAGARVRAGDRVGTVDVLGVPQEVAAPADGLVGATLVASGDPVEYGQDVVEIELLGAAAPATGAAATAATGEGG